MTNQEKKDSAISAGVTFLAALLILLLLFFGSLSAGKAQLAEDSIPEPAQDEITFIEPELDLSSPGAESAPEEADEAPLPQGEPDPSPVKEEVRIEKGTEKEPRPVVDKPMSQKKPSPVKTTSNTATSEETRRLKDMGGKFGPNGSRDGKNSPVNGQGKTNARGSLSGRKFLGCNTSTLTLNKRVVVKVQVKVNAEGRVTSASAVSGPGEFRARCVEWARTARWSEKPGAPVATGSITFTITPK